MPDAIPAVDAELSAAPMPELVPEQAARPSIIANGTAQFRARLRYFINRQPNDGPPSSVYAPVTPRGKKRATRQNAGPADWMHYVGRKSAVLRSCPDSIAA